MRYARIILAGTMAVCLSMTVPVYSMADSSTVVAGGGSGSASVDSGPGIAGGGPGSGLPGMNSGNGIDQGESITDISSYAEDLADRTDYFAAQVANPIVQVVEKYSYDRMAQDLKTLSARYPDRLHLNTYGTSLDGRPLYEAVLGNPNAPKHILIHAGIHGREYMTPLLVMKQLEYGLVFYDTGNFDGIALSKLLDSVAVHFVPMVNPDGISISQGGVNALRSNDLRRMVDKCYTDDVAQGRTELSYEDYQRIWKSNARGVDLNQNFPADWDLAQSAPNPSYAVYKGTSPLSEPETQALAALTDSGKWSATISYHSMGNVIYWDYEGNKVRNLSGELATVVQANTGYLVEGSSGYAGYKDWVEIKDEPIPSLTIEVGGVSCPLPLSEFPDIWNRNKMVWALVAEFAMIH